ncbi:hypothetical protein ACT3T8_16085 [Halomonas sp. AOP1-B1-8]|uniref:hypothetical protein n=1 Tax=Halomonas sp. AOP1-B1-8 TaxID=3457726 RepID=UPI003FDBA6F8
MSGFSAEYLAQVEEGMALVTATSSCLDGIEQLLGQEPTPATIKGMVQHLGVCAASVNECEDFDAIMPHDSDELQERYMTLAQRAGHWVNRIEKTANNELPTVSAAHDMDYWKEHADQLEAALLDNSQALMLHFLKTATPLQISELAHARKIETDSKSFTSTQAVLMTRLERNG